MPHFSPREQQILHLVAQHHTYAEMGMMLGMRYGTLRNHMQIIYHKADVHRLIHLAGYAQEQGYGRTASAQKGNEN